MGYKKDVAKGIGGGTLVLIVVLVIGGLISGGIWLFGVATSGIKGQGDAVKINNSAENWTKNQAYFHKQFEAVKAADQKIGTYKTVLDTDPKDKTALTNYTSMVNQCKNYVAEYNAKSADVLARDWKDPELPTTINELNPATDCK